MVRLEKYKCDRCSKEFNMLCTETPPKLTIDDFGEKRTVELCEDCAASNSYWMKYYKEFDNLIKELALKETGEE
jgi:hypothetical protein